MRRVPESNRCNRSFADSRVSTSPTRHAPIFCPLLYCIVSLYANRIKAKSHVQYPYMSTITVQAPANIAFIKYWGNNEDNLPLNNNISMTLSNCQTTTSIQKSPDWQEDVVELQDNNGTYHVLSRETIKERKAYEHIERIRTIAGASEKVHIRSRNSFPTDSGIASSASGFCALTGAVCLAYNLKEIFDDKLQLSKLVRLSGSASAARSVYGGFVELLAHSNHDNSYAVQLAPESHWALADVVAIISMKSKETPTSEGHRSAPTSPYFQTRLNEMQQRIVSTRDAIRDRDFEKLGVAIEADTVSMHAIMMTSTPPLYYWEPGTIEIIKQIRDWRKTDKLQAYFSIDAGANVHVICEQKDSAEVEKRLNDISCVAQTITNEPSVGVREVSEHLF